MWRIISFLVGFTTGFILGASIILLVTPQSGEEVKERFKKEFAAKKSELEAQLIHFQG